MERADQEVLDAIERQVLRQPKVLTETLRKALERVRPRAEAADAARQAVERQLAATERELEHLTAAIGAGGPLQTLVAAVRNQEAAREALREQLAMAAGARAFVFDPVAVERELRAKLGEWQALLRRQVPQARQVLKKLLEGPIQFTPQREVRDGQQVRAYLFRAPIAVKRLIAGSIVAISVASPTGFEPVFWP